MIKIIKGIYILYAIILGLFFLFLALFISWPFILFMKEKKFRIFYFVFHFWFRIVFFVLGIFITNKYQSYLAKNSTNVVFVVNHLSYLDAMVVTASIRKIFRPLGKSGVTSIPLIGLLYKQFVILVSRTSVQSKIGSLKQAQKTLKQGYSVLLFPEGTFYTDITQRLNSFKDGAFHLAIETQTQIQPLILINTRKRLHPKSILSLSPGKIIIHYLNPISVHGYTLEQTPILKGLVFNIMKEKLDELQYPQLTN